MAASVTGSLKFIYYIMHNFIALEFRCLEKDFLPIFREMHTTIPKGKGGKRWNVLECPSQSPSREVET